MTKQKLISLIIKKQTYKQLRQTITQVHKQNNATITNSSNAILQILTKEYNAQSKLYALRFLKDCFEQASPKFIKATEETILPVIVNIVIDSTDEAAITKYAGSSFTKAADLEKFKSIMVSFFKLAKESIMKWAQWVSDKQYKFKAAYSSLLNKGVRFQGDFKYYRPQNQTKFFDNCQKNGLKFTPSNSSKQQTKPNTPLNKSEVPSKPLKSQIPPQPNSSAKQPIKQPSSSSLQPITLSKRFPPKSKNKHILKCHQLFKFYDNKILANQIQEKDIEDMKDKVNSCIEEYMNVADLNQNQMEEELTAVFENIKNIDADYHKFLNRAEESKIDKNDNNSSLRQDQSVVNSTKSKNIKKTQPLLLSNKKVEPPFSPINQLKQENETRRVLTGFNSPKNKNSSNPGFSQNSKEVPKKDVKQVSRKQKDVSIQMKKRQVFEDDSYIESNIQSKIQVQPIVNEKKQPNLVKPTLNMKKQPNITPKSQSSLSKQSKSFTKQSKPLITNQASVSYNRQNTKQSKKQRFDSNISLSHQQSSRVNFSQSQNQSDSEDGSNIKETGKFNKDQGFKLSSIAEEQQQKFAQSSRRGKSSRLKQQSSLNRKPQDSSLMRKQQDSSSLLIRNEGSSMLRKQQQRSSVVQQYSSKLMGQNFQPNGNNISNENNKKILTSQNTGSKLPINPSNQIPPKLPHQTLNQYENKIKTLQTNLKQKQEKQQQLQRRLNELTQLKLIHETQLERIREENNRIIKQFENAVDSHQYEKVKKEFYELRYRNTKMQEQMEKLSQEMNSLRNLQLSSNDRQFELKKHSKQHNVVIKQISNNISSPKHSSSNKKSTHRSQGIRSPPKPTFTYTQLDSDYVFNRTHITKLPQFMEENNLILFKKNIINASQLFYNHGDISFACKTSFFQSQKRTLLLQLSFQLNNNGMNKKKDFLPQINIANVQELDVWKKPLTQENQLFKQEIVVKLKNFPFRMLKCELCLTPTSKQSLVLPFLFFSFLKKAQFNQDDFDIKFQEDKDSIIKSKVFNLNPKVVPQFKSIHFYQGYNLVGQNRICFRLNEQKDSINTFWCQLTSLAKFKCILKIIPSPYNEQTYTKAEQLMENLIFLIGA